MRFRQMIVPPQYSHFDGRRRAEFFILRNVVPVAPVVGRHADRDIFRSVVDEWGRRYSFVGIASFRREGGYDCDALRTGEFILPPGIIYQLDYMPTTFWELLCRLIKRTRRGPAGRSPRGAA